MKTADWCGLLFLGLENNGTIVVMFFFPWPNNSPQSAFYTDRTVNTYFLRHSSITFDWPWQIGHFRVPKNLTFKTRLSAKPLLWKWVVCIIIENHFHINGFALSLAFKVRFFGTRKWPDPDPKCGCTAAQKERAWVWIPLRRQIWFWVPLQLQSYFIQYPTQDLFSFF